MHCAGTAELNHQVDCSSKVDLRAHILIQQVASSLAPEPVPDTLQELGHLLSILLLQPLLVQPGSPGLVPLILLLLPYQVLLRTAVGKSFRCSQPCHSYGCAAGSLQHHGRMHLACICLCMAATGLESTITAE